MNFLYSLFINGLKTLFFLLSPFNQKIKQGYEGRKKSLEKVQNAFTEKDEVIWMHAASLGEYEQGLPVLETLKKQLPNHKILITFFSPSGYEHIAQKKHPADVLCYLPFDTKKDLFPFINAFNPKIFFTVKYDFWYRLLDLLNEKNCQNFAIATHFYPSQIFFKPYGKWFIKNLNKNIKTFFHQTENSLQLAQSIGLKNNILSGDTRFDRVKSFRERNNEIPFIKAFKGNQKLIIFGSTWEGEEIALEYLTKHKNLKIIVAPHSLHRIEILTKKYPHALLYSTISKENPTESNLLLIDSIGLLTKLYSYADIAIVGGGFHKKGLHNILEPTTFGIPVLFGNHYKKNPEADALISRNGAKSFTNPNELAIFINELLQNEEKIKQMSKNAYQFISQQPNSTKIICENIFPSQSTS